MFSNWFSNRSQQIEVALIAPITGKMIDLEDVPDPVFSQRIMGEGIAFQPTEGLLVSPVNGTVTHLFHTNHAVGLTSEEGLELLIHIGIDTVKLNGKGFTPYIQSGDIVKSGDKLIQFDLDVLNQAGCPTVTPVIITNGQQVAEQNVSHHPTVQAGKDIIMNVVLKSNKK